MNQLDILIINYNSTEKLLNCLDSLFRNAPDIGVNVFVYDNNSHDGVDVVSRLFPQVSLTMGSKNIGFSSAVNRLLEKVTAPYIMLLNPDTTIIDGFFKTVMSYMDANPEVGIVGPKVVNRDGSTQGSARLFPTLNTAFFGRTSLLTRLFPNNRISRANILTLSSNGRSLLEPDWISGACMVVRRQAFQDVGPLDERFFMYWEDADWCKRMWQAGWKVVYNPNFAIMHTVGGSSSTAIVRSVFSFHQSTYKFFCKHNQTSYPPIRLAVLSVLSLRLTAVLMTHGIRKLILPVSKETESEESVYQGAERLN